MTREEFSKSMVVLASGVRDEFPRETLSVWFVELQEFSPRELELAVRRHLQESPYPKLPALGRLRRLATEARCGILESPEAAFQRVRQAVKRCGYLRPEAARRELGDAIWQALEGVGGWDRVCDMHPEDRGIVFAQFRDSWLRFVERTAGRLQLSPELRPRIERAEPFVRRLAEELGAERG